MYYSIVLTQGYDVESSNAYLFDDLKEVKEEEVRRKAIVVKFVVFDVRDQTENLSSIQSYTRKKERKKKINIAALRLQIIFLFSTSKQHRNERKNYTHRTKQR